MVFPGVISAHVQTTILKHTRSIADPSTMEYCQAMSVPIFAFINNVTKHSIVTARKPSAKPSLVMICVKLRAAGSMAHVLPNTLEARFRSPRWLAFVTKAGEAQRVSSILAEISLVNMELAPLQVILLRHVFATRATPVNLVTSSMPVMENALENMVENHMAATRT